MVAGGNARYNRLHPDRRLNGAGLPALRQYDPEQYIDDDTREKPRDSGDGDPDNPYDIRVDLEILPYAAAYPGDQLVSR